MFQPENAVDVPTRIAEARVGPTPLFSTPLSWGGEGVSSPDLA